MLAFPKILCNQWTSSFQICKDYKCFLLILITMNISMYTMNHLFRWHGRVDLEVPSKIWLEYDKFFVVVIFSICSLHHWGWLVPAMIWRVAGVWIRILLKWDSHWTWTRTRSWPNDEVQRHPRPGYAALTMFTQLHARMYNTPWSHIRGTKNQRS